jgi:hypothetical protein
MTNTDLGIHPEQPDDNESHDIRAYDEIDLIEDTVAGITDADIEEQLRSALGRAGFNYYHRVEKLMQSGSALGDSTVLKIVLGAQLRRLREAAGITRDAAGYHIRASRSKISRMELGRVSFKKRDVADLLDLYGTASQQKDELVQLAREANATPWWQKYREVVPDWFQVYLGLEEAATLIRVYEVQFVPGLLQTEEYARAVVQHIAPDLPLKELDDRVNVQMGRQKQLVKENPPYLWAIVDESALRRPIGNREMLAGQIERLIDAASEPNIILQVMPFKYGGHGAEGGAFTLMRFPEADLPDVVYMEYLTGAHYIDKPDEVEIYAAVMERLSVAGTSPEKTREILADILKEVLCS